MANMMLPPGGMGGGMPPPHMMGGTPLGIGAPGSQIPGSVGWWGAGAGMSLTPVPVAEKTIFEIDIEETDFARQTALQLSYQLTKDRIENCSNLENLEENSILLVDPLPHEEDVDEQPQTILDVFFERTKITCTKVSLTEISEKIEGKEAKTILILGKELSDIPDDNQEMIKNFVNQGGFLVTFGVGPLNGISKIFESTIIAQKESFPSGIKIEKEDGLIPNAFSNTNQINCSKINRFRHGINIRKKTLVSSLLQDSHTHSSLISEFRQGKGKILSFASLLVSEKLPWDERTKKEDILGEVKKKGGSTETVRCFECLIDCGFSPIISAIVFSYLPFMDFICDQFVTFFSNK